MELNDFKNVEDKMLWKGAALAQITQFETLAQSLNVPCKAVGSHRSKSIDLPVIELAFEGVTFYLRDNFYDINLCVRSSIPITLSFSALFEGVCEFHDWEWYLSEIAKCRGYSWSKWTDEQMDDPCCLRRTPESMPISHDVKSCEVKDRWIKRLISPEWYEKDWSGGKLSWDRDKEFGPGVTLFKQVHPYAQGIDDVVPSSALKPYESGSFEFILCVGNIDQSKLVIERVLKHWQENEFLRGFYDGIKDSGLPQLRVMLENADVMMLDASQKKVIKVLIAKREANDRR